MFLQQLFEAIDKQHAAFCFGRMNPPTVGHGQLIDTVARAAAGGDYYIFTGQTQDAKKNPLDYATKVKFIRALFPQHSSHVVEDLSLKTIIQVAQWLYNKGYRSVTFVAGGDRIDGFRELLTKYNGVEGPSGLYKFDKIDFVSSGERDPDADGIAGVSASAAREAAAAGNLEAFGQATGAGELAEPLYNAVRKGLLVEGMFSGREFTRGTWDKTTLSANTFNVQGFKVEFTKNGLFISKGGKVLYSKAGDYSAPTNRNMTTVKKLITGLEDKVSRDPSSPFLPLFGKRNPAYLEKNRNWYKARDEWLRTGVWPTHISPEEIDVDEKDLAVTEDASGYIPKNKKEAKDPRWSNALSVDVQPDTPNKNMKAMRLK